VSGKNYHFHFLYPTEKNEIAITLPNASAHDIFRALLLNLTLAEKRRLLTQKSLSLNMITSRRCHEQ